jgi:hypothetical protein
MSEAEDIVFQDREVTITRQSARFGSASFPLAAIGAVLVKAPKTGAMMVVAILLMVFAISNAQGPFAIPAFIVAAVIMVVAYRTPSSLVLRNAGGETQALVSRDRRRLRAIKAAIESARPPPAPNGAQNQMPP